MANIKRCVNCRVLDMHGQCKDDDGTTFTGGMRRCGCLCTPVKKAPVTGLSLVKIERLKRRMRFTLAHSKNHQAWKVYADDFRAVQY